MAKGNQFHRAGNTFRHVTSIKIPLDKRTHNKNKWKPRELPTTISKVKKGDWWKKKLGQVKK